MSPGRLLRRLAVPFAATLLAGCASYRSLPLDTDARAPSGPSQVEVDAAAMPLPSLRRHRYDPGNGLDMTEVAMLAVANNPQLKLARDDLGIARAQAFAAGLLPDPVLDLARDFPINGDATTSGYDLGLSYGVTALLTRSTAERAARDSERQVDLNLLWLEWQVVSRARRLFVRHDYERRALALLRQEAALLARRQAGMARAQGRGDVSLAAASADLAALQTVRTRADDMARRLLATKLELDSVLGLAPDAKLDLVGRADLPATDNAKVRRALAELPRRRPDLLALRAGYRSQDARYRQAILAQFPAIDIGFTRARDTGGVNTRGLRIGVTLPIFNRNRGNIAIEDATRKKLHDAYSVRLEQARAEVERILRETPLLERQRDEIEKETALTARTLKHADAALAEGDLAESDYVRLKAAWIERRLDLLDVNRALLKRRAVLLTLLGGA